MPPFPEALPGLTREAQVFRRKGCHFEQQLIAEGIEDQPAGRSLAGQNHRTSLQNGERANPSLLSIEDEVKKSGLLGLFEEDRKKGGAIENKAFRQNRPRSS